MGAKLNIKTPSTYLAKADKLMASSRAKQMAVNEVDDGGVDEVSRRKGGKQKQRDKDVCINHARFK